jgi:hypothetical protein
LGGAEERCKGQKRRGEMETRRSKGEAEDMRQMRKSRRGGAEEGVITLLQRAGAPDTTRQ